MINLEFFLINLEKKFSGSDLQTQKVARYDPEEGGHKDEERARRTGRGPVGGGPQTPREPPASPRRRKMKRGQVWHLTLCRLAQLLVGPWKKISNEGKV